MKRLRRIALAGATLVAACTALAPGQAMAASETCTGGATGIDGYVFNNYQKLTAQQNPADPKTSWICWRVHDPRNGGTDRGGRIDVTGPTVAPTLPSADGNGTACTTTVPNGFPSSHPIWDGQIGNPDSDTVPYTPWLVDAYASDRDVWGCFQAGPIGARVKVSAGGVTAPQISQTADPAGLPLPPQKQGPFGYPSNKCLENFWHVRIVNMRIQDTHVWLYRWPESATRTAICVRVQSGTQKPVGYRLWVDTNNAPGITPVVEQPSTDTLPCTDTIAQQNNPVPVRVATSPEGSTVASVCVEAAGIKQRVSVGYTGTAKTPQVGYLKDPDSA